MSKYKLIAIISYPLAVYLLWIWFGGSPRIFTNLSLQAIIHSFVLTVAFLIWIVLVYGLSSCLFSKFQIQRKLQQAERSLGNISRTKIKSYKPSKTGNFVTLMFYSAGVPEDKWEEKRAAIQSAINYTIIDEIKHKDDDYGIIVLRVRKGCIKTNMENLYDEEF